MFRASSFHGLVHLSLSSLHGRWSSRKTTQTVVCHAIFFTNLLELLCFPVDEHPVHCARRPVSALNTIHGPTDTTLPGRLHGRHVPSADAPGPPTTPRTTGSWRMCFERTRTYAPEICCCEPTKSFPNLIFVVFACPCLLILFPLLSFYSL